MNDELAVHTIVMVNKAKEAEESDENQHIVSSEVFNTIPPGLSTVSHNTAVPFIESTTGDLLAKLSEDPLCIQLT